MGNMGNVRGAAAVREAKLTYLNAHTSNINDENNNNSNNNDVVIAVLAIQLGLLDDAARLV